MIWMMIAKMATMMKRKIIKMMMMKMMMKQFRQERVG